jgi:hypothetical protein
MTRYGQDSPGIASRQRRDFTQSSRSALGHTQLPVRLVLGLFPDGNATGAWGWPPTPIWRRGWRKSRAIPLFPVWAFMACSRVTFASTFYYHYLNCRTARNWALLTHNKVSPLYLKPWRVRKEKLSYWGRLSEFCSVHCAVRNFQQGVLYWPIN